MELANYFIVTTFMETDPAPKETPPQAPILFSDNPTSVCVEEDKEMEATSEQPFYTSTDGHRSPRNNQSLNFPLLPERETSAEVAASDTRTTQSCAARKAAWRVARRARRDKARAEQETQNSNFKSYIRRKKGPESKRKSRHKGLKGAASLAIQETQAERALVDLVTKFERGMKLSSQRTAATKRAYNQGRREKMKPRRAHDRLATQNAGLGERQEINVEEAERERVISKKGEGRCASMGMAEVLNRIQQVKIA